MRKLAKTGVKISVVKLFDKTKHNSPNEVQESFDNAQAHNTCAHHVTSQSQLISFCFCGKSGKIFKGLTTTSPNSATNLGFQILLKN